MPAQLHRTVEERAELGKSLREQTPRSSHGEWSPAPHRPDPVSLIEQQNEGRLKWLIPVRRWRMSASPFAFFRGSARIMAADLASTPVSELAVQACGDAHLANFGLYASPERQLVFDINDFDESLTGPWEWDIKRLAASFTIAARHNGLKAEEGSKVTERVVKNYRKAMADFAGMRITDVWYSMLDEGQFIETAEAEGREDQAQEITDEAQTKDSHHALDKLTEEIDGVYRIRSEPPGLVPLRELREELELSGRNLQALVNHEFKSYQQSVADDCKRLLEHFSLVDVALKVVGVGSVGTRCMILLLEGRDKNDPLFLQIKQANCSVLEEYLKPGPYQNQGQRVVEGQRLMQAVSDIFLGWTRSEDSGEHFYWRQLRDWKGSVDVENVNVDDLKYLARSCGWTLARAHARSGDPVAIAAYLGSSDRFDESLVGFAERYADQNEKDYEAFVQQIRSGKLAAVEG
ncbi:MAG: DUF2252 domain-containing protein [Gammaproteobacteria bacterium]|nr:DUF2252 domain-containing protein [Gammaproteobacteria bacterium]